MTGWISQVQDRDSEDVLVKVYDRFTWDTDEEIGKFISELVRHGYYIVQSDEISVTLRSPMHPITGAYSFIHCWRQGHSPVPK